MANLSGKCAIVTGAGRGLGRAIAQSLAVQGCRLVLVARSGDELLEVQSSLPHPDKALVIPGDLLDQTFLGGLVASLEAPWNAVDVLVNNAGIAPSAPLERTTDDLMEQCLRLNVQAPLSLCRQVVEGMKKRGWGRIVNVASTAALKGYAYTSAYSASKHALLGLTRALAAELLKSGITVNAVCPGFSDTRIVEEAAMKIADTTGRSPEEAKKILAGEGTLGRLIRPREVAEAVSFLLGANTDAMTGLALPVAGDAV